MNDRGLTLQAWIKVCEAVDASTVLSCSTAAARELPKHGVSVLMVGEAGGKAIRMCGLLLCACLHLLKCMQLICMLSVRHISCMVSLCTIHCTIHCTKGFCAALRRVPEIEVLSIDFLSVGIDEYSYKNSVIILHHSDCAKSDSSSRGSGRR